MTAEFACNRFQPGRYFSHFFENTLGSGHAILALRADWQGQLLRARDDPGTLTNQMNKLLYSFHNADQIFDSLLSIGIRPFVELSFMPKTRWQTLGSPECPVPDQVEDMIAASRLRWEAVEIVKKDTKSLIQTNMATNSVIASELGL